MFETRVARPYQLPSLPLCSNSLWPAFHFIYPLAIYCVDQSVRHLAHVEMIYTSRGLFVCLGRSVKIGCLYSSCVFPHEEVFFFQYGPVNVNICSCQL